MNMTRKDSNSVGFLTSFPLPGFGITPKSGLHSKRACSGIRASATTPPPSGEDNENDKNKERNEEMDLTRASLEKSFSFDLKPKNDANGQCDCIWCGGTKQRMCRWCDGKGFREEFVHKSWDELAIDIEKMQSGAEPMKAPEKVPVVCSACSGSKKLRCAYCHGSGIGSYGHSY